MKLFFIHILTVFYAAAATIAPPHAFKGGWQAQGETRLYPADRLYEYMDGAAELFLEMGCNALQVQIYEQEGQEISLELFEMRDVAAATGIFLWQPGACDTLGLLTVPCKINPYQVIFYKDRYFVRIANFSGAEPLLNAMLELSRAIIAQIPEKGTTDPFTAFPEQGRIPANERILRGPVSVRLFFGRPLDLGFLNLGGPVYAAAARYSIPADGYRIVVYYENARQALAVFQAVQAKSGAASSGGAAVHLYLPPFNVRLSLQDNRLSLTFTVTSNK